MAFKIIWSKNAEKEYQNIIDYLLQEWSVTVAENFTKGVKVQLDTLQHFPEIGMPSKKRTLVRRIVVSKHNKLYYRLENNKIYILKILDTRQNPAKNRFE